MNTLDNQDTEVSREELVEAGVVQHYRRYRDDSGESICGIFRCDFEPLQQRATLHIPIHPPLSRVPKVEAIGIDCDLRTIVTDCQKFGIRIEVVLDEISARAQPQFLDVVISAAVEQS